MKKTPPVHIHPQRSQRGNAWWSSNLSEPHKSGFERMPDVSYISYSALTLQKLVSVKRVL